VAVPPDPVERSGGRVPLEIELVQVPAERVGGSGAFGDQVFAVVDEQPKLAIGSGQVRGGQSVLARRGAGDSQSVDRVGLAVGAGGITGVGHELGRNADDTFTGGE
jgi:hypothetical protein